jgi:hypothetical protein
MKRGFIVAAVIVLAAVAAGCSSQAVIPAFLLPKPVDTASAAAASVIPAEEETTSPSPTPAPTETVSAQPTATLFPVPSPSPSAAASSEPYKVLATYQSTMPAGLNVKLKYSKYSTPLDYFVALRGGRVYTKPSSKSTSQQSFSLGSRYKLDKLVQGIDGKSKWYHVLWTDKHGAHSGFVSASAGSARSFRAGMMLDRANELKADADTANTVYIMNYKNTHGLPPKQPNGSEQDAHGNRRSMSAPAYTKPDSKSSFIYAPDGLLGTKLETSGNYTKVHFPSLGETRWVPTRYLSKGKDAIPSLTQLVVVDRQNQNSGTFEYVSGSWRLIALTYVSTGKSGGYYTKTPLGDFMAQEKSSRFYYYYDGSTKIEGYAPWAVRFSGGGYLHGVPRKSKYDASGHRSDLTPGETLRTLGTTPQSHMCVRNYTSYAKFIYDWYRKGSCAVIVFE